MERRVSYTAEAVLFPPEINPLFTELPFYCVVDSLLAFRQTIKSEMFLSDWSPPQLDLSTKSRLRSFSQCAQHFSRTLKKLFVNNKIILFFLPKEDLQKQLRPSRCRQMLDVHRGADNMMSHLPTSPITSAIVSLHPELRVRQKDLLWWNRESRGEPRIPFYGTTSNFAADLFSPCGSCSRGDWDERRPRSEAISFTTSVAEMASADKMQNHRSAR